MVCTAQAGKTVADSPPPDPGANLLIDEGDKLTFAGDSYTSGYQTADPWFTTLVADWGAHIGTVTNLGAGGTRVDQINVGDIVATGAEVVCITTGTNDWRQGVNVEYFGAELYNKLTAIKAGLPGVKIACLSFFCYGEEYPDPNADDIDAFDAQILFQCSRLGVTYIDWRTAQQAWEAANNTPPPGVNEGLLTIIETPDDGIGKHPNAAGLALMTTAAGARITTNW